MLQLRKISTYILRKLYSPFNFEIAVFLVKSVVFLILSWSQLQILGELEEWKCIYEWIFEDILYKISTDFKINWSLNSRFFLLLII